MVHKHTMSIIENIKRRVVYMYDRHVWYIATVHMFFLTYILGCFVFCLYSLCCAVRNAIRGERTKNMDSTVTIIWYMVISIWIGTIIGSCVPFRTKPQKLPELKELCATVDVDDVYNTTVHIGKGDSDKYTDKYVIVVQPSDV